MILSRTRVSVCMVVGLLAGTVLAVNIETVLVGNPGNSPDMRYETPGYGSVGYAYNIGKYEVTAGQYTEFLNAVGGVDTYGLFSTDMWVSSTGCKIERYAGSGTVGDPYRYRVASDWANRPVNYVSWGDAARFANWLHNGQPTGAQGLATTEDGAYYLNGATSNAALMAVVREVDWKWALTSEDEWYKAAYHKNDGVTNNYFDYPTSSNGAPDNELIDPDSGNNANFDLNGYAIGDPYYRTEVGEFENSGSPYGTFDQGGNVLEWHEGVVLGSNRGLRGGAFSSHLTSHLHASTRHYSQPAIGGAGHGFRVVEVPEPATIGLLALGGLLLTRRQR